MQFFLKWFVAYYVYIYMESHDYSVESCKETFNRTVQTDGRNCYCDGFLNDQESICRLCGRMFFCLW